MKLPFKRLKKTISSGFTLIELLIVMAILGVLSIGLVAAINPIEKINSAGDSRAQSDIGVLARATESFATARTGYYPSQISDLTGSNELKYAPVAPNGSYYYYGLPTASCLSGQSPTTGGTSACTGVLIEYQLRGAKYTNQCTGGTPVSMWIYASSTGQSCMKCAANTNAATLQALTCP